MEIKITVPLIDKLYDDVVSEAAKEGGKALTVIAKAALIQSRIAPLQTYVYNYEIHLAKLHEDLGKKLETVPDERIQTPEPHIAVPILQAMTYTGYIDELRDMYAALLATGMDSKNSQYAHPSFVEIIKQLNPDEARILKCLKPNEWHPMVDLWEVYKETDAFDYVCRNITLLGDLARVSHPALCSSYIDNLARLGLIELLDTPVAGDGPYTLLEMDASLVAMRADVEKQANKKAHLNKRSIVLTEFGKQFCQACVFESGQ